MISTSPQPHICVPGIPIKDVLSPEKENQRITHVVALFIALVDDTRETEVGYFEDQLVSDEHITSSQVAMNYLQYVQ